MRLLVLVLVASCTPGGGDDIECAFNDRFVRSTDTDDASVYQTTATAVGGKQKFAGVDRNCGMESPIELRTARFENPALATVQIINGVAVVTGVAEGMTVLDATGTNTSASGPVSIAAIDLVGVTSPSVATGTPFVQIKLSDSNNNPVVDDSLTVTGALALGDHWDHIAIGNAAPGDYMETIHAGGKDWPVTVTVTP